MKSITFTSDEALIDAARARAAAEHTTLDEQFRRWLAEYADGGERNQADDHIMTEMRGRLQLDRRLSRDDMNER